MKGLWLHFTHFFHVPSGMATLDSCRVIEAMMPMMELYGVDIRDLPAQRSDSESHQTRD